MNSHIMVSAGGGCEAAVTVRTRYGLAKLRECGELLYGRRFPLRQKRFVLLELRKASNIICK